ncbi:MAG: hypothetical protein ACXV6K_10460, partial [Halobacteriota archaeon]
RTFYLLDTFAGLIHVMFRKMTLSLSLANAKANTLDPRRLISLSGKTSGLSKEVFLKPLTKLTRRTWPIFIWT